jgi:hypothetical protein
LRPKALVALLGPTRPRALRRIAHSGAACARDLLRYLTFGITHAATESNLHTDGSGSATGVIACGREAAGPPVVLTDTTGHGEVRRRKATRDKLRLGQTRHRAALAISEFEHTALSSDSVPTGAAGCG